MPGDDIHLPQLLPVLSRGKHRNPRRGACFIELASFLAGERWSDHPGCAHPLLAALARQVNDRASDADRQRLAGLIPSVIGLTSDDPHLDALIALRCATTALPVVAAERQQVMAVAILTCHRVLAALDGRPSGTLQERSRRPLALARRRLRGPGSSSATWAPRRRRFTGRRPGASSGLRSRASLRRASRRRTTCCETCSPGRSASAPPGLTPPSVPPSTVVRPRRRRWVDRAVRGGGRSLQDGVVGGQPRPGRAARRAALLDRDGCRCIWYGRLLGGLGRRDDGASGATGEGWSVLAGKRVRRLWPVQPGAGSPQPGGVGGRMRAPWLAGRPGAAAGRSAVAADGDR